MSTAIECDFIFASDDDTDPKLVLSDGRTALHYDGVDHRASPSEVAECILRLAKKVKRDQELIEVIPGDDTFTWAVVPKL